jgi:hypothetical protein
MPELIFPSTKPAGRTAHTLLEAKKEVEQALLALVQHNKSCQASVTNVQVRTHEEPQLDNTVEVTLELWWTEVGSKVSDRFRWDTLNFILPSANDTKAFLQSIDSETDELHIEKSSAALKYPPNRLKNAHRPPLFQYQPERFRAEYPCAKKAAQFTGVKAVTAEALQELLPGIISDHNERLRTQPLRQVIAANDSRGFKRVLETAFFYSAYYRAGRQIYDIPKALVGMFKQTDIYEIPVSLLKFPYDGFYLHFGAQTDLESAPGWHLDGAYVSFNPEHKLFQILVTSAPENPDDYGRVGFEPTYVQAITAEFHETGLGEAAEQVFLAQVQELSAQMDGKSAISEGLAKAQAEMGLARTALADVSARNAALEAFKLPKLHQAYLGMLRLVVNAIAYLSAYPADIESRWPDNAPKALLDKVNGGTPKERARALSKLAGLGYTPVHHAGRQFAQNLESSVARGNRDGGMKTHWRRGHWRRQQYGPNRTMQKLVWLMPVLVNPKKLEAGTELGHIYLVS